MDSIALVENQIDDGQELVDALDDARIDVTAAFWALPAEKERWSLYLVLKLVDDQGQSVAYREILPVLQAVASASVTSLDIKVVGEKEAISHDVIELRRRFPGRGPLRVRDRILGGTAMDEVYLYSMEKVKITVYELTYRGDPMGTVHFALEPHNPNCSMIVDQTEYPAQVGLDCTIAAPVGAKIERDKLGRKILEWDFHGKRTQSDANEVWSLANLGLHGFRILGQPAAKRGMTVEMRGKP